MGVVGRKGDMTDSGAMSYMPRVGLSRLWSALQEAGYHCYAPRVEQGTVRFVRSTGVEQLPWGWRDEQHPGHYRLRPEASGRAFAWANGPQAIKPMLFTPEETLWRVERTTRGLNFIPSLPPVAKRAVIGVRSCDLAALALQDAHFLRSGESDEHYARRREGLLLVAVNCALPAATCFCASTGDGPNAENDYDLLLDELDEGFLLSSGSDAGHALLEGLSLQAASAEQKNYIKTQRAAAVARQSRTLPQQSLSGVLARHADSRHWQTIAERCLACGNCTAVCPSCFCHREQDESQLDGESSEHRRYWDSCFSAAHSMLHGSPVRAETVQRYRQWLTHKFDYWQQQYGRSGCVGCGRCITWCPVGIDITEELSTLCGECP